MVDFIYPNGFPSHQISIPLPLIPDARIYANVRAWRAASVWASNCGCALLCAEYSTKTLCYFLPAASSIAPYMPDRSKAMSTEQLDGWIIGQTADALIFADCDGVIRRWNAAASRIFGFDAAEALVQSLDIIIPKHLRESHWRGFDSAI